MDAKKYTWVLIVLLILGISYLFFAPMEGFQDASAKTPMAIPPMTDPNASNPDASATAVDTGMPLDTQLPPAQMPASMYSDLNKPSLEQCKKYYNCGITATMS
jgi:hypothetical protein